MSKSMSFQDQKEILGDMDENILLADGFEDALIGYVEVFTKTIALYDKDRCLDILIRRDGMSLEEANEFFEYNVIGAYVGEYTPAFATLLKQMEERK